MQEFQFYRPSDRLIYESELELIERKFYGSPLPPFYAIVRAKVIQPEKHLAPVTKGNFLAHAQ